MADSPARWHEVTPPPTIDGNADGAMGRQRAVQASAGMSWLSAVALALGVALATALFLAHDPAAIAASVAACGWGLAILALYRFIVIGCDALAWRQLIPAAVRPGLPSLFAVRWIAKSINTLLPVVDPPPAVRSHLPPHTTTGSAR